MPSTNLAKRGNMAVADVDVRELKIILWLTVK